MEGSRSGDGALVREKLGVAVETPVLLLYTRFFEFPQEKLHFVLGEVFRRVPRVRFLVVGQGRHGEEEQLRKAAAERGFAGALDIAGWVEPAQLPDYFAAADVAIYPFADTLVNRCKCPAKLTELLQAGLPVVADRVGQIAEYIEAETSGVLCEPQDREGMVARTVQLLTDRQRARLVGEEGRRRILREFCWPRYAEALLDFYARP